MRKRERERETGATEAAAGSREENIKERTQIDRDTAEGEERCGRKRGREIY